MAGGIRRIGAVKRAMRARDEVELAVNDTPKQERGDLNEDELAVVLKMREIVYGTVEVQVKDCKITNIRTIQSHQPPSLTRSNR